MKTDLTGANRGNGGKAQWKVHTYGLLNEIANHSGNAILSIPLNVFGRLLAAVGERAAEINDPKLNALMCRLTIYTVADPASPDYDAAAVEEVMKAAEYYCPEHLYTPAKNSGFSFCPQCELGAKEVLATDGTDFTDGRGR